MLQSRHSVSGAALLALATWVAFTGMLYELVLAQSMAAAWGATLGRYQFTIGLYLAAMGLGAAIASHRRIRADPWYGLLATELALSLLGPATPIVCLVLSAWLGSGLAVIAYAAWIAIIGALVGAELPLLLEVGGDRLSSVSVSRILAADYFGMLLAGAIFTGLLLPGIGVFGTSLLSGVLSALATLGTAWLARGQGLRLTTSWRTLVLAALFLSLQVATLLHRDRIEAYAVGRWFLAEAS